MDVLEYNAERFILMHKRSLPLMFGFTFFGAGLVLLGFFKINSAYPLLGLPLLIGGLAMLFMSAPQSYITFDKVVGKMEIQRRWVYFKKQLIQFPLGDIHDVRTTNHDTDPRKFKVEILAGGNWIPFTELWIKDDYNKANLEAKVRAFLQ